ncbi:3'-5' exoribonuclease [Marinospirillum celere]|uniref:3'-5' exoribonuclease n=1 Tax=Marinospirillum celere TaxID=1122252 RepID=A0A1I1EJQ6_9GAMM|nr:HD domain-containing protein [Marinospirillum celere]SFB87389.1 3'-5' exoribonuclease [Marinospirillum celere]
MNTHKTIERTEGSLRCKFTVLDVKPLDPANEQAGYQVTLDFMMGTWLARVDADVIRVQGGLSRLDFVDAVGCMVSTPQESYFKVSTLIKQDPWVYPFMSAAAGFPKTLCPDANASNYLKDSIMGLKTTCLREFVWRTLMQKRVLEGFLVNPASYSFHHSYVAGLLWHSLEVAHATQRMIECFEPDMSEKMRDIAFVGGLLHDIGKAVTLNQRGIKTTLGKLVDHSSMTLELCSSSLSWLEMQEPDAAHALRHIWTSASPGARYGVKPMISLARYVRDADGQSSMVSGQRQSFGNQPWQSGFRNLGSNHYWQPGLITEVC